MNNKEYLGEILDVVIDCPFGSKHPKHGFDIINRTNDDDDKLIIVPENKNYSNEAIDALIEFQEQYFNYEIIR